jgi:5'-3' exonuclease
MVSFDCLLIDAKNCLYRAAYAGSKDKKIGDTIPIFFRFIASYISRFAPKSVHIFWDAPRETLWRKEYYQQYKEGRIHKILDLDVHISKSSVICKLLLEHLGCRNYEVNRQEADDLIYAFCRLKCHKKILIVSNDGDFKQIAYMFRNITLFNPLGKDNCFYEGVDEIDPVDLRCLTGEVGDNIDGYKQIGPIRAKKLILDDHNRQEFFDARGAEQYMQNRLLIDLSISPYVRDNMLYILKQLSMETKCDLKNVMKIIRENRVSGMLGEMSSSMMTFKGKLK